MKKLTCLVALTFMLLCNFIPLHFSATFYVATTGDDITGTGSIGSPWKTINKAVTTVLTSGDIIHINAGTYTETTQLNLAAGVNLIGDDTATTIVKSTVNSFQAPLLRLSSADGTSGNQTISNIKFDGQSLATSWGIYVEGRSNVSIHDVVVKDFGDRGVIFAATSGFAEVAPSIYATGNSFYNSNIRNCAAFYGGYGTGCLNIGGQQDMNVYNNTITQNQRTIGTNGWCIKHFQGGYWKNVKIYSNTITKIAWTGTYGGEFGWNFAIESYHHNGVEIYSNTITGGSIDLNYCSKGAYTYGAYIHDNNISMPDSIRSSYHDAVHLEFSLTDVVVQGNTFNNMAGGVIFATRALDSINRVDIQSNVMTNLGRAQGNGNNGVGIGTYSEGTYDYTINGLNIYNNTITAKSGAAPFEGIHINGVDNGHAGSIRNVNIKNNIVQGFYESWLRINNGSFCNTLNVSYNNLYLNALSNAPYITGGSPVSYTSTPNYTNIPLFVSGTDFHLQSGSTLIGAGQNVGFGIDIGKYQYSSDVTPPAVLSVVPLNGANNQLLSPVMTGLFSEAMLTDSVNVRNVTLEHSGTPVTLSGVTYNPLTFGITLNLVSGLSYNTVYTVKFKTGLVDVSGNHLATQYSYFFTTAVAPSSLKRRFPLFHRRQN